MNAKAKAMPRAAPQRLAPALIFSISMSVALADVTTLVRAAPNAPVRCSIFEGRLNEVQSELIRDDGGAFLARAPTLWYLPDVENYALRRAS